MSDLSSNENADAITVTRVTANPSESYYVSPDSPKSTGTRIKSEDTDFSDEIWESTPPFLKISDASLIGKDIKLNLVCHNFEECRDIFLWELERVQGLREPSPADEPGQRTAWVVKRRSGLYFCLECRVLLCGNCVRRAWKGTEDNKHHDVHEFCFNSKRQNMDPTPLMWQFGPNSINGQPEYDKDK